MNFGRFTCHITPACYDKQVPTCGFGCRPKPIREDGLSLFWVVFAGGFGRRGPRGSGLHAAMQRNFHQRASAILAGDSALQLIQF
jgi:hypothetical protein